MGRLRRLIIKVVKNWPGYSIFKEYSYLPVFFVAGAALEYAMINWHVGEVNFYKTFKKNQVDKLVDAKLHEFQTSKN